ncbi:SCP2 domain-containing protein [Oceaniserpentilla sp. 4NH20-0058]|uniref:ubiquinone biosynthesis accessory factor UbiJ n=1 Tax=Oceaniserpentilla sp. 4NH20-0058 TaxID=3127660 RepID=UPI003109C1B6
MDQTLIQAALVSAEGIINQALRYDPATSQKLAALGPKVLAIEIEQPALRIYVRFGETLSLMSNLEDEPHAKLSGELKAFINLATHKDKHAALMKSDIQIQGSSQLAMGLADAMDDLDIDFEAMISELTGPVVAHVIGNNLRKLGGWFKNTTTKVKQDSVEYVRDELKLAPHKLEGESQFTAIHKLKLDGERLEARINRLATKLNQAKP